MLKSTVILSLSLLSAIILSFCAVLSAEYIVSLAHLKWETFMHAVTEKYTNLYWSHTLLVNR